MGLDKIHDMLSGLGQVASFAGLKPPAPPAQKPATADGDKVETKSKSSEIYKVPEPPASGI